MDSLLKASLFLLIGTCCAVYRANAQDKYMLDNSTNNHCGKTFKLEPDKEIILASSGRAPKDMGFCSAMVYAIGKDDKNCHGLCMTVLSQFINVCHAKIQFKGMAFGKDVDPYKELSCFHRFPNEWCFHTNVMSVEIVETRLYAFELAIQSYNFSVKVAPLCDNSPFGKDIEAREEAAKERAADARDRARNHGILVGICLAVMFLIVLLITWCYYKNKPFRTEVHKYPTAHIKKGPTFAGFRAKMTLHKGSDEAGETKKEKKHKASKDEASTENEDTKPKKRGFKFLNKLRSSRAEEVPLVDKKDGKVGEAAGGEDNLEEIKEDENIDNKSDKGKNEQVDETKEEKVDDKVDDNKGDEDKTEKDESKNEGEEKKDDSDSTAKTDAPTVTVTTPGDNENDSKNDSSDDS